MSGWAEREGVCGQLPAELERAKAARSSAQAVGLTEGWNVPKDDEVTVYAVRGRRLFRRVPARTDSPSAAHFNGTEEDLQQVEALLWRALRRFPDVPDTEIAIALGDGQDAEADIFELGRLPPERADPVFTFTPSRDTSPGAGVGFPNPYYICDAARLVKRGGLPARVPWSKKSSKVYWRGALSVNPRVKNAIDLKKEPRMCLAELAAASPEDFDVGFTNLDDRKSLPPAARKALKLAWGGLRHVDGVDFLEELRKHKYHLNVDGVAASWRALAILAAEGVMLLQDSRLGEFFVRDLQPWVHYVPVRRDLSDLQAKLAHLRAHDGQAAAIATAGRRFARDRLGLDGAECYVQQALRVMAKRPARGPRGPEDLASLGFQEVPEYGFEHLCSSLARPIE